MMTEKPKYKQLFAAWIKKTKTGEDFLSICLGDGVTIMMDGEELGHNDWLQIWGNKRKFSPKHPDFVLLKKVGGNYDERYVKQISTPSGEIKSDPDRLLDEVEEALR